MKTTHQTSVAYRFKAGTKSLVQCSAILLFVGLIGCQRSQPPQTATSEKKQPDAEQVDETAKQKAIAAKDALFAKLSGRLSEVMSTDGPAAAISVCSHEAATIAENVGKDQGVAIGRTSFKLRNAKNTPPDWARSLVEQRSSTPEFVTLHNGNTGALLPIRLKKKCVTCHGPTESIAADIRLKLKALYPDDRATGFKEGDLRGWFWVEVPSAASSEAVGLDHDDE